MTFNKTILSLGIAAATTTVSQGAVLSDWDFTGINGSTADGSAVGTLIASGGNAGPPANAGNTVALNVTSTDLVGTGTVAYEDFNGGANELNLRDFDNGTGATGFMDFTLTAAAGFALNIEDVVFSAYRNGAGAASTFQYQTNVDGAGFTNFGAALTPAAGGGFTSLTFDGTDIANANSVVFRFSATGGSGNIHFNDIKVNGSVSPIPEPSSTALLGLGGLALILRRRK